MRRGILFVALAATALVAVPGTAEGFGRRGRAVHCQPACPVWYYAPSCPSAAVGVPFGYPLAQPGYPFVQPGYSSGQPGYPIRPQPPVTTVTIRGRAYRIIPHPDRGTHAEDERDVAAETLPPGAAGSNIPASDRFMGT